MTRIAIFVEGHTELIFMDRLVQEFAHESGLAVEHAQASGGSKRARRWKIYKQVTPGTHHQFYVLIVNCTGDSKVKSDILDRYQGLVKAGYSLILGLRDVYGQFQYDDLPRLRASLSFGLPREPVKIELFLSVMEIEAWFLAEHTHFQRLNPKLTVQLIRDSFSFDPSRDNLELRPHPSEDIDRIYELAGFSYAKKLNSLQRTVNLLDLKFFLASVVCRFEDLERMTALLAEFFERPAMTPQCEIPATP